MGSPKVSVPTLMTPMNAPWTPWTPNEPLTQQSLDIKIGSWPHLNICVTIMCRIDELSWLFTIRFIAFYLTCRKYPNLPQNFCYSHSFNFNLSGSTLYVSKQPSQLIPQPNSSLWLMIVTMWYWGSTLS